MTRNLSAQAFGILCIGVCAMTHASAQSNTPAGATALCKDGTFYTGPIKQGACEGHEGVQEWYEAPPVSTAPSTPSAMPPATSGPGDAAEERAPTPEKPSNERRR